jgi:hypothetical protein
MEIKAALMPCAMQWVFPAQALTLKSADITALSGVGFGLESLHGIQAPPRILYTRHSERLVMDAWKR